MMPTFPSSRLPSIKAKTVVNENPATDSFLDLEEETAVGEPILSSGSNSSNSYDPNSTTTTTSTTSSSPTPTTTPTITTTTTTATSTTDPVLQTSSSVENSVITPSSPTISHHHNNNNKEEVELEGYSSSDDATALAKLEGQVGGLLKTSGDHSKPGRHSIKRGTERDREDKDNKRRSLFSIFKKKDGKDNKEKETLSPIQPSTSEEGLASLSTTPHPPSSPASSSPQSSLIIEEGIYSSGTTTPGGGGGDKSLTPEKQFSKEAAEKAFEAWALGAESSSNPGSNPIVTGNGGGGGGTSSKKDKKKFGSVRRRFTLSGASGSKKGMDEKTFEHPNSPSSPFLPGATSTSSSTPFVSPSSASGEKSLKGRHSRGGSGILFTTRDKEKEEVIPKPFSRSFSPSFSRSFSPFF
jgi:hypothetical protein